MSDRPSTTTTMLIPLTPIRVEQLQEQRLDHSGHAEDDKRRCGATACRERAGCCWWGLDAGRQLIQAGITPWEARR